MVPSADDRASKVNNGLLIDDKLIFLPANGSMTWLGRRDISYCLLFFISRNNLLLIAFCCRDHKASFIWMRDCVAGEFRSSHVASEVSFLMASQSPAVRGMRRGQRRGPPPQLSHVIAVRKELGDGGPPALSNEGGEQRPRVSQSVQGCRTGARERERL